MQIALVSGNAGVGKTSLMREFSLRSGGVICLRAQGYEEESLIQLGILHQLIASVPEKLQSQCAAIPERSESADSLAIGASLLETFGNLEVYGTLLILIDDLPWMDKLSADSLLFALRRSTHDQVLVLASARSEELAMLTDGWQRLMDESYVDKIVLKGLSSSELAKLSLTITGVQLDTNGARRLRLHTGGDPIHARALLEEIGAEPFMEGRGALPAPRSLAHVVSRRLDRCSSQTRAFIEAGAVLGQRFRAWQASDLAEITECESCVGEALDGRLLEAIPGSQDRELTFPHALAHAAVYGGIVASQRFALHNRAALTCASVEISIAHRVAATVGVDEELGDEIENLAVFEMLGSMGHSQSGGAGLSIVSGYFAQAFELSRDSERRSRRACLSAFCAIVEGDTPSAVSWKQTLESSEPGPWRDLVCGLIYLSECKIEIARTLLESAFQGGSANSGLAHVGSIAALNLAGIEIYSLDSQRAGIWLSKAHDLAEGDPSLKSALSATELSASLLAGLTDQALEAARERAGQAVGNDTSRRAMESNAVSLDVQLMLGVLELVAGSMQTSYNVLQSAWEKSDAPMNRLMVAVYLSETAYRVGRLEEASSWAELCTTSADELRGSFFAPDVYAVATLPLAARGEWNLASESAARSMASASKTGLEIHVLEAATALASIAYARNNSEELLEAASLIDFSSMVRLDPGVHLFITIHADALIATAQLDEAEKVLGQIDALLISYPRPWALAACARTRGVLYAAQGSMEEAASNFNIAIDLYDKIGARLEQARSVMAFGQALLGAKNQVKGRKYLDRALDEFAAMGATAYVELTRSIFEGAGIPFPGERTSVALVLTPQETMVARNVRSGLSNREIAEKMFLSVKTIEYHLRNIYMKLNISSRSQLISILSSGRER